MKWTSGELSVEENWKRLAVDVTHYKGVLYLTLVDCGPSRFCLWRRISDESGPALARQLENIFIERGPPTELLMDNGKGFRSRNAADVCQRWNVQAEWRCAYRPSGNGIVERNHRTIKRSAERAGVDPCVITFWLNSTPNVNGIVPAEEVFCYKWSPPKPIDDGNEVRVLESGDKDYKIGQTVFVKPAASRCTTKWPTGTITNILSRTNVEIDGTPRHVGDIRPMVTKDGGDTKESAVLEDPAEDSESEAERNQLGHADNEDRDEEPAPPPEGRPRRRRYPPARYVDYDMAF